MEHQQHGNHMYQSMGDGMQGMAYSQQLHAAPASHLAMSPQQQQPQMIYGSMGPSSMSQPYTQQQQPQMFAYQQQQHMVYAAEYPQNQQMMHPQHGYATGQMEMTMEPSAPMVSYGNPQAQYLAQQQYQQQQQQMYAPGNAYGSQSY
ncbi:hypothetical protein GGH95_006397 [Coemansia sp. RSA 1836]|nr:hypothetical protein GGH95_006397 [Coemansia sp. RSA 1836]